MYTQDVKLIIGNRDYRRSAAICYVPSIKEFSLKTSSEENFKAYFEFEALYVILNEADSHEYYLDEQERLFKLDNAASFNVEPTTVMKLDGNPIGHLLLPDINAPLNNVCYDYYEIVYEQILEKHGKKAIEAYLSAIKRFSEFDETVLFEAYADLEKQYPKVLSFYYDDFIKIRKDVCRKFLDEVKNKGAGR